MFEKRCLKRVLKKKNGRKCCYKGSGDYNVPNIPNVPNIRDVNVLVDLANVPSITYLL